LKQNEIQEEEKSNRNEILSESDLGSELDDELFNIADIRKYYHNIKNNQRNSFDDSRE
jgi:hypothetical protein